MNHQVKRTLVAQAAMETSDILNLRFAGRLVGTQTPRRLMVAAPDGPSTQGGKRVRQSIVLAAANDPSAGTVMVGWLDIAQKKAELRTHAVVKAQYEQRYHQAFDVPQDGYDAIMRDVQSMFQMQSIDTAVIAQVSAPGPDDVRTTTAPVHAPPAQSGTGWLVGVGVLCAIGAGAAAFLFLR